MKVRSWFLFCLCLFCLLLSGLIVFVLVVVEVVVVVVVVLCPLTWVLQFLCLYLQLNDGLVCRSLVGRQLLRPWERAEQLAVLGLPAGMAHLVQVCECVFDSLR